MEKCLHVHALLKSTTSENVVTVSFQKFRMFQKTRAKLGIFVFFSIFFLAWKFWTGSNCTSLTMIIQLNLATQGKMSTKKTKSSYYMAKWWINDNERDNYWKLWSFNGSEPQLPLRDGWPHGHFSHANNVLFLILLPTQPHIWCTSFGVHSVCQINQLVGRGSVGWRWLLKCNAHQRCFRPLFYVLILIFVYTISTLFIVRNCSISPCINFAPTSLPYLYCLVYGVWSHKMAPERFKREEICVPADRTTELSVLI